MANDEVREHRPASAPDADRPLPRFYAHQLPTSNTDHSIPLELDPDEARHATRALRLAEGDPVEAVDGSGRIARGHLRLPARDTACIQIDTLLHAPRPTPEITVASAIPKGSRGEDLIDMLVQAGADRLTPLDADRSVVHPAASRADRWTRRALAGLKQSRRVHALLIDHPIPTDALLDWTQPLRLFADTTPDPWRLTPTDLHPLSHIALAIGPEGGWSDRERQQLHAAGWRPWSLGTSVMRVETAAAAAVAVARYLADTPTPQDNPRPTP